MVVAGTAILEDDHGPDRRVALDVGDVVALDAFRRALEVERLGERREHRLGPAAVVIRLDAKLFELLLCGLGQLSHQGSLATAPRHFDRHGPASFLAQPAGDQLRLIDLPRKDDRARDVRRAGVVLEHEATQQLSLGGVRRAVECVAVMPDLFSLIRLSTDQLVVSGS